MKNRWLIAASAVGIQISIGSVYAWSVVKTPMTESFGWTLPQISFTFSLSMFIVGLSAAFMGHFVELKGPRISGTIASVLFGLGVAGSGLAMRMESIVLLYIFYGVIGGIGLGIGYVTPIATLIRWFPDKRGLATGIAIMGFGFAAFLSSFAMKALITSEGFGLEGMFYVLGFAYFAIMFISSQYLAPPPEGWLPAGFQAKIDAGHKVKDDLAQLTANQALKTARFYFLWFMLFINITCGIAIISVAEPMGIEMAGMATATATSMVAIMGIFNGLGRIIWSGFSDLIGRPMTWILFFVIQFFAFLALPSIQNVIIFQIIIYVIISCYGGGFASIHAFISDMFGTKQVSAIIGYILTAWSAAGIVGPMLLAFIRARTESFSTVLHVFSGFFAFALIIAIILMVNIKKITIQNAKSKALVEADVA